MVYHCASAECKSHDAKRARPDIHPLMQDVTWVKFPKDSITLSRWLRLIRRGGKSNKENIVDDFKLHRNARLCSRHFDRCDILDGSHPTGDPKYFAWNNWGKPINPRSTSAMDKLNAGRQAPVTVPNQPLPSYSVQTDMVVPEVSNVEEVISHKKAEKELVGGKDPYIFPKRLSKCICIHRAIIIAFCGPFLHR